MSAKLKKPAEDYSERYQSYTIGFVLSVLFTLIAFALVITSVLPSRFTIAIIILLAIAQLLVQLFFFLHLGEEKKPRLSGIAFIFMGIIVFILVAGTLWIMANLDYESTPENIDTILIEDQGYSPKK